MFLPAALGAYFGRGIQKKFQFRARKNHRADVAAFHYHSASGPGTLLLGHENAPHRGNGCQQGSGLRDFLCANLGGHFPSIQKHAILCAYCFALWRWRFQFDVRFLRERFQPSVIVQGDSSFERFQCEPSVHRAAIEVGVPEKQCHAPRHAAFA